MAFLKLKTQDAELLIEIGTEEHVEGAHIHVYAGGSSTTKNISIYEADKGYIILEALPKIKSKWGNSNYSTSLTGRESSVEKIEKISEYFEILLNQSQESNDAKNSEKFNWLKKQILDYYFKYSSSNARFEVSVTCKSEEIRIPLPWPLNGVKLDTKTANLEMSFTFRILKLVSPEEMQLLNSFLENVVNKNLDFDIEYQ